jgi:hypothetical protein
MGNVINLPAVAADPESDRPEQRAIRVRSRLFAALFTTALALALVFTLILCAAVLFYDGPLLAFGPGGVWIAPTPGEAAHLSPLTAFSFGQRLTGVFALMMLTGPAIFIFLHLRSLFQLYAKGVVFAQVNAHHIKATGTGLIAYAMAPFLANRAIWLAGVTLDPVWFHFDEVQALVLGGLLFVIAGVMQLGCEIEQERDGFV